ncbi:MAG: glycoside hydrolase family 16 protein [Planctomycetota bacterium]|nr:glycoside hydrolase family 16 protein [Planctomycetota bacterium]
MTPFKSSLGLSLLTAGLLGFTWAAGHGDEVHVRVAASSAIATSSTARPAGDGSALRSTAEDGWFEFEVEVPVAGRYESVLDVRAVGDGPVTLWIEDYVGNPDGRTYDITGPISLQPSPRSGETSRSGSPLNVGGRRMRVHHSGGRVELTELRFELIRRHQLTPTTLVQRTEGDEWTLVWSDEFNDEGGVDDSKWTADIGDWGWGNREPQLYTEGRLENARCEGGSLVIEARKDELGAPWTSARLTTRGKVSFQYGRLEIRAKAPVADGTWGAGWLLGDAYRDELSWPYCGEVDIFEAVGREIDDRTGDGINHGSCHTRAYYFKQGNHISSTIPVEGMGTEFHLYAMEWTPRAVKMFVDGEHYYTYDKRADELEWPFDQPQNIILNLAMGGGMGGDIDPGIEAQELLVDYVRVYGRR